MSHTLSVDVRSDSHMDDTPDTVEGTHRSNGLTHLLARRLLSDLKVVVDLKILPIRFQCIEFVGALQSAAVSVGERHQFRNL